MYNNVLALYVLEGLNSYAKQTETESEYLNF